MKKPVEKKPTTPSKKRARSVGESWLDATAPLRQASAKKKRASSKTEEGSTTPPEESLLTDHPEVDEVLQQTYQEYGITLPQARNIAALTIMTLKSLQPSAQARSDYLARTPEEISVPEPGSVVEDLEPPDLDQLRSHIDAQQEEPDLEEEEDEDQEEMDERDYEEP